MEWTGLSIERLCEITLEVDLYSAATMEWATRLAEADPSLTRLRDRRVNRGAEGGGPMAVGEVQGALSDPFDDEMFSADIGALDAFDVDPASLTREELANAIDELTTVAARLRHAAERIDMTMAGVVAATGLHLSDCVPSANKWVAQEHGVTHADASRMLRADRARRRHSLIDAAARAGMLTVAQLDAIDGIVPSRLRGQELEVAVAAVDEIADELVRRALELSIDEFRRLCIRARSMLDTDGSERPGNDDPAAPSKVYLTQLFNGRWSLVGDLSTDDGAVLESILDDHLARGARALKNTAEVGDAGGREDETWAPRSVRAADALKRLIFDGAGASTPGRAAIYLHVDLESLRRARWASPSDLLNGDGARIRTEARLDISEDTLWGLLAGADVTPVFYQSGSPVSFGRTRRVAAPIQRRIMAYRYDGCAVRGCDATPNWTQGHHLIPWERGGPTDIDNLAPKCSPHHHGDHAAGVESTESPPRLPSFLQRLTASSVRRPALAGAAA